GRRCTPSKSAQRMRLLASFRSPNVAIHAKIKNAQNRPKSLRKSGVNRAFAVVDSGRGCGRNAESLHHGQARGGVRAGRAFLGAWPVRSAQVLANLIPI